MLATTWYYYNESGNVTRVVTNVAGTDQYESTRMGYAKNGNAVSYVMGESWTWSGSGMRARPGRCARPATQTSDGRTNPANYDIAYAMSSVMMERASGIWTVSSIR